MFLFSLLAPLRQPLRHPCESEASDGLSESHLRAARLRCSIQMSHRHDFCDASAGRVPAKTLNTSKVKGLVHARLTPFSSCAGAHNRWHAEFNEKSFRPDFGDANSKLVTMSFATHFMCGMLRQERNGLAGSLTPRQSERRADNPALRHRN